MKVWDMHCDTLSKLREAENAGKPIDFMHNDLHLDLEKMRRGDYLLQSFACYVDMEESDTPLVPCMEMIDIFYRLLKQYPDQLMQVTCSEDIDRLAKSGRIGAMLTLEEGAVCMDDVRILRSLYRLGARMMTLTWNYDNGLASPNVVDDGFGRSCDRGLKDKGIEMLEEMERLHMIVDVSHLSDGGFWDVVKYGKRPFAASHSDARALTPHVRNLTDEMIRAMAERGGLIGLNYCASFLSDRGDNLSRIEDMIRHTKHLLDVGGEDILGLGSDFDGIGSKLEMDGAKDLPLLAEAMEQSGISMRIVEKIFHGNAVRFFKENL